MRACLDYNPHVSNFEAISMQSGRTLRFDRLNLSGLKANEQRVKELRAKLREG
jgi:hypothetical protein